MGHPKLVLTYFGIKGKAEAIRLALYMKDIPFEDRRIDYDGLLAIKPNLPFGQVPSLEVDGKMLVQSIAILQYAGSLAGLMPSDPWMAAKVMEILMSVEEIASKFAATIYEKDAEKKKKDRKVLGEEVGPRWLVNFEKLISTAGDGHCVGNQMTIADIHTATNLSWLFLSGLIDDIPNNMLDNHPAIKKVIETVMSDSKAVEWNNKHGK